MNKVGIDISNAVFDVTIQHGSNVIRKQFSNTKTGHRQFIRWALYQASLARVCLEATGIYHLQLALALDRHPDTEVMIVNPYAARRFAQAQMVRAKTDAIDADGLLLTRLCLNSLFDRENTGKLAPITVSFCGR